jgi:hypothetical protein
MYDLPVHREVFEKIIILKNHINHLKITVQTFEFPHARA